jgi:hypothetical protein
MTLAQAPALIGACFILAASLNQDHLQRLLHHAPLKSIQWYQPEPALVEGQINAYGPVLSAGGSPSFHEVRES